MGTVDPEGNGEDKGREIPCYVHVCKEKRIQGKMEPERRTIESSLAGTGPETPGQPRLSSRKMQRTPVDSCTHANGSSELEEIICLQAVVGMKPETAS